MAKSVDNGEMSSKTYRVAVHGIVLYARGLLSETSKIDKKKETHHAEDMWTGRLRDSSGCTIHPSGRAIRA